MPVDTLDALLAAALSCHRRGQVAAARASYAAILSAHPRCFDAHHLLGILDCDAGEVDRGIASLRCALAIDGSRPQGHYSLATALLKKGDAASALRSLERALTLPPPLPEVWFLRGNLLQQADRNEEAIESYGSAISLRPAFPEAYNNLAAAQRAVRQSAAALENAQRALALRPDYALAHNNLGLILLDGHRAAPAVGHFRSAVAIEPRFAEAWHNLGTALMELRHFAAAAQAFARLAAIAPGFRHVQGNLLFAKLSCCDWAGFEGAARAVEQAVGRGEHAALPAAFLSMTASPALQLRCAALYTQAYFPPRPLAPSDAPRRRSDRIRVAYLSGDFGEHAVTYLLAGVFERHDASRFDTTALSWDRRGGGPARRRMEAAFSRFIDVTDSSDAAVARLVRELDVDIAVDLMGHTLGQRTGILARRPAPVQVNYLGLPATMGAPYIDYLIADRYLVPADQAMHYAEQLVYLPGGFQPNDDRRALPAPRRTRSEYGLPENALVLCCFNRQHKIVPACFDVWMRLLQRLPGSVLWLLASEPAAAGNLRAEAGRRGVDARRLAFAGEEPYEDYLARYLHADLFLDTFPFNGGATVSDAVSMGIPVVTCVGHGFASRMAGSILTSLGFPQLATRSLEEYEAKVAELGADRAALARLRAALGRRDASRDFFDTDLYRVRLETAFTAMWDRAARGEPPGHIAPADPPDLTGAV